MALEDNTKAEYRVVKRDGFQAIQDRSWKKEPLFLSQSRLINCKRSIEKIEKIISQNDELE